MTYFKKDCLKLLNFLTLILFFPLIVSANGNYPAIFALFYWGPILLYIFAVFGLWWLVSLIAKRNRKSPNQNTYLWKLLFVFLVIVIIVAVILLASVGSIGFVGDFTWMYPLTIGFVFVCYAIWYGLKRPIVKFFNNYFIASYIVISVIVGGVLLYTLNIEALAMSGNLCEVIPAGGVRVSNGDYARDYCFTRRALTVGESKGCTSIANNDSRDECYIGVAFKKRDISLCSSITSSLRRHDCFVSIFTQQAKETNNISICDRIIEDDRPTHRPPNFDKNVCRDAVIEFNRRP